MDAFTIPPSCGAASIFSRKKNLENWNCSQRAPVIYTVEHMSSREFLGEFEQIVLLAVLRLQKDAYGVPIRCEIEHRVKRTVTVGALYSTLDRLESKGYVSSWFADPTAERGGRSKRFFRVEPLGLNAIRRSQEALAMMLEGLDLKNV